MVQFVLKAEECLLIGLKVESTIINVYRENNFGGNNILLQQSRTESRTVIKVVVGITTYSNFTKQ